MNKFKRALVGVLALTTVLTMTACGAESSASTNDKDDEKTDEPAQTPEPE